MYVSFSEIGPVPVSGARSCEYEVLLGQTGHSSRSSLRQNWALLALHTMFQSGHAFWRMTRGTPNCLAYRHNFKRLDVC
jgi:hypothetical protein